MVRHMIDIKIQHKLSKGIKIYQSEHFRYEIITKNTILN